MNKQEQQLEAEAAAIVAGSFVTEEGFRLPLIVNPETGEIVLEGTNELVSIAEVVTKWIPIAMREARARALQAQLLKRMLDSELLRVTFAFENEIERQMDLNNRATDRLRELLGAYLRATKGKSKSLKIPALGTIAFADIPERIDTSGLEQRLADAVRDLEQIDANAEANSLNNKLKKQLEDLCSVLSPEVYVEAVKTDVVYTKTTYQVDKRALVSLKAKGVPVERLDGVAITPAQENGSFRLKLEGVA